MATVDHYDSESDFYGDEELVAELQARVDKFDPAKWYREHSAVVNNSIRTARRSAQDTTNLHNPYAGVPYAWQLSETVENFLERLPPLTTDATDDCPWIFICNPYISRRDKSMGENQESRGNEDEAPEEQGTRLKRYMNGATERLHIFTEFMERAKTKTKSAAVISSDIKKGRDSATEDILMLAHVCKVRSGKWMIFCQPQEVNEVWALVAQATANNELGVAAKVAPRSDETGRRERVICVYTADFANEADVLRVLRRLRALHVLDLAPRGIYYKPDAFTYVGIASGNIWNIKASLYSSFELFKKHA